MTAVLGALLSLSAWSSNQGVTSVQALNDNMDEVGGRLRMSRSVSKVNFQTKHTKLTISKVAEQRWSAWVNHKRSLQTLVAKSWAQRWLLERACSERMLSVYMCLFRSVGLLSLSRFLMWSRKCLSAPLKSCLRWGSKLFVRVSTTTTYDLLPHVPRKLNMKVETEDLVMSLAAKKMPTGD